MSISLHAIAGRDARDQSASYAGVLACLIARLAAPMLILSRIGAAATLFLTASAPTAGDLNAPMPGQDGRAGESRSERKAVPYEPGEQLIAQAQNEACHLWVEGERTVFRIRVEGLVPGEAVEETIRGADKPSTRVRIAKDDGTLGYVLFDGETGKRSGELILAYQASRCRLEAIVPWRW